LCKFIHFTQANAKGNKFFAFFFHSPFYSSAMDCYMVDARVSRDFDRKIRIADLLKLESAIDSLCDALATLAVCNDGDIVMMDVTDTGSDAVMMGVTDIGRDVVMMGVTDIGRDVVMMEATDTNHDVVMMEATDASHDVVMTEARDTSGDGIMMEATGTGDALIVM
jgi:hypothetical protein